MIDTIISTIQTNQFLTIPREELDTDYESYAALEKEAKEKRRGQGW